MDASRHRRAAELFQAAADLPATERSAFLSARCEGDVDLRGFVESLLADHDAGVAGPLDAPGFGARPERAAGAPSPPARLGAYELVRVLGEGGMAVVYEARQESPSRTVALKVLRPGVLSGEMLRRFRHEIDVLGRLQHPGIAHIYEAAVADVGAPGMPSARQPYFVMELIRGAPLTEFAASEGLTTAERLELVARVCDAVQYAHQKGVIHRDLKPANILVVSGDTEGSTGTRSGVRVPPGSSLLLAGAGSHGAQPKILDFGVARVVGAEVVGATMNTEAGRLIGTLAYMSPEQLGGDVEQTDTRSDVYALGVILYELLAGRLPHDVRGLVLAEAVRRIREEEPARLGAIDRGLRGEGEVIVARAMAKDRARRYPTAHDLGADIRRHLHGEAIDARRDSAMYMLRKGLRRYRALVAAGVAAVLGLALFAGYAWVQAGRYARLS